ncbi:YqaA family protein [Oceanibacterium hippocampi]|uniref:SNARE associated Golgi protein n=1 Tax=Oceanibacterium hippocampi TaxID=745714 RepID=A0A1Y5RXQ9_9PROT|nr:YqaA family protein [Oceanibacterium hippocampi]SLN26861.1 SNARE associated Golgi protein [Oceanibacterium hippocampi]
MLRRLYDWTMSLAGHRNAETALAGVSFAESSFFPVPPDVMLIPMVLARPDRAWRIALICSIASVIGGLFGYAIGYFFWGTVGQPLVEFYGFADKFAAFQAGYNDHGGWIVALFGFTPFPYKVITIASGVTQLDLVIFLTASVLTRSARFFLVAALLKRFGEPIREFIEKRLGLLTIVFFVMLFAGFVAVRYLV